MSLVRWRLFLLLGTVYAGLGAALRITLWARLGGRSGVTALDLPTILGLGLWRDLRVLLLLLIPLSLYLWLVPNRIFRSKLHRSLVWLSMWATCFGLTYLACVEYFFFEEFDSRFNLVAVDYLLYPHEVLVNIWDSYPVLSTLVLVGLASALWVVLVRRHIKAGLTDFQPLADRSRWLVITLAATTLALAVPIPSVWSDSGNRAVDQMADNGLASFFQALRTSEIDYRAHYLTGEPAELEPILLEALGSSPSDLLDPSGKNFARRFVPPAGKPPRTPNVVLILEESFGAEFVGAYGNPEGLTPSFDALSQQGLLFEHAFATGTRTVRGLEAIIASLPPIPSVSVVKRPGGDDIATWGGVMSSLGYDTTFLYGGYSYFDGMRKFFSGNGFAVLDRTDIKDQTFANIWGVCDEDLFRFAIEHIDQRPTPADPFFDVILTTSNHKPFSFPEGVPGVPTSGGGRLAGVQYADYALGKFFAAAALRPWFEDTLFVVVADHGARVYGAAQIPLPSYEIPLLVIWPGTLDPTTSEAPISLMDLAPTVLGLLGQDYVAPFFGRDVLSRAPDEEPILLFNHNHDVGVLRGDELVVLGLKRSAHGYHYSPDSGILDEVPVDEDLERIAIAYFQTAFDQFHSGAYRLN
ncbi:MAG: LTA synthase family protein [Thermoanaerobaculia bacterium]|nr:LTA synthase family protein [Thermoanaerobaculia bacterium]